MSLLITLKVEPELYFCLVLLSSTVVFQGGAELGHVQQNEALNYNNLMKTFSVKLWTSVN